MRKYLIPPKGNSPNPRLSTSQYLPVVYCTMYNSLYIWYIFFQPSCAKQNQPRYQNITFNHFFVVVVAGTQMIAMFINILRTCHLLCTSTIFTFRSFPCQFLFMAGLPYVTTLILRILLNLLSSSWHIGNNWRRILQTVLENGKKLKSSEQDLE